MQRPISAAVACHAASESSPIAPRWRTKAQPATRSGPVSTMWPSGISFRRCRSRTCLSSSRRSRASPPRSPHGYFKRLTRRQNRTPSAAGRPRMRACAKSSGYPARPLRKRARFERRRFFIRWSRETLRWRKIFLRSKRHACVVTNTSCIGNIHGSIGEKLSSVGSVPFPL